MEESTQSIKIYNHYPKFENYNPMHCDNSNGNGNIRISDIENSIHASLIVSKMDDNNKCNITETLKILITFSFVGSVILIGLVIVLFLKK